MWAQGAIALLGTRNDPLANSLRLDAINKRDRRNAAIDYFEIYCGPDQVTGYFLTSIASWLAEAKGVDAAEALLAKATPTTAGEPNAALHADANAACTSGSETDASRAVKNQSLLPAPGTLRNDTEGRRLNAEARADAERLLDDVRDHPNAYFAELVELTRQYLGLVSGDPAIVEESKKAIGDYMADPETRTTYVSLATLFDIDFDSQTLAAQLDQISRLGPWDNMQLRAAFDLTVMSQDPDTIAGFVDKHREQLAIVVGSRQSNGVAIEALAAAGRVAEARKRLDALTDTLSVEDIAFLGDLVSESSGDGSPDIHLARYEATGEEQDLSIAVKSMRAKGDGRLPEFAYDLWKLRRRVQDAVIAANAFAWFGRDIDLRELLAELGDTVKLDPVLETHLAWIRYREGISAHLRKL